MPYITRERRKVLEYNEDCKKEFPFSPGELNYMFCELAKDYITIKGESYQTYNDIIGALEGAKMEIYRRLIAPYEENKIKENGDVF
jgi:hypothetical protein